MSSSPYGSEGLASALGIEQRYLKTLLDEAKLVEQMREYDRTTGASSSSGRAGVIETEYNSLAALTEQTRKYKPFAELTSPAFSSSGLAGVLQTEHNSLAALTEQTR